MHILQSLCRYYSLYADITISMQIQRSLCNAHIQACRHEKRDDVAPDDNDHGHDGYRIGEDLFVKLWLDKAQAPEKGDETERLELGVRYQVSTRRDGRAKFRTEKSLAPGF